MFKRTGISFFQIISKLTIIFTATESKRFFSWKKYNFNTVFYILRSVSGIYATMGVDGLPIKPSVGFHVVMKTQMPVEKEMNFDMDNTGTTIEQIMTLDHETVCAIVLNTLI